MSIVPSDWGEGDGCNCHENKERAILLTIFLRLSPFFAGPTVSRQIYAKIGIFPMYIHIQLLAETRYISLLSLNIFFSICYKIRVDASRKTRGTFHCFRLEFLSVLL